MKLCKVTKGVALFVLLAFFCVELFALDFVAPFGKYDFSKWEKTEAYRVLVLGEDTFNVRQEKARIAAEEEYKKEREALMASIIEEQKKERSTTLEKARNNGEFVTDKVLDLGKINNVINALGDSLKMTNKQYDSSIVYTIPFTIRATYIPMENQSSLGVHGIKYNDATLSFLNDVFDTEIKISLDDNFNYQKTDKKSEYSDKYEFDKEHPAFVFPKDARNHVYDFEIFMVRGSYFNYKIDYHFYASKITQIK